MGTTQPTMAGIVDTVRDPQTLTMSSREIADLTGSTHDNVLKTVRSLVDRGVVSGNETPYVHPQNGQTYSEFKLDYRNTMVVVSGYTPELRARIIDRWMELEGQTRATVDPMTLLNDPTAMRGLLLSYSEKVLALEGKVEAMAGDVQALDRIAKSDGSLCLTDAAKAMQARPKDFIGYLRQHGWIYKRAGSDHYIGYQARVQSGDLEHKVTTVLRPDGSEKITEQVKVTPKGLAKLAKLFGPRIATAA